MRKKLLMTGIFIFALFIIFGNLDIARGDSLFTIATSKTLSTGETWTIGGGYTLTAVSIDARANPRQVWIQFKKDGALLDDKVVSSGATYTYGTIFSTILSSVFAGATTDMAQFGITTIAGSALNLFPVTTRKTLTTGETWAVGGGYTLTAVSIDARATPRQVWIQFKKDGALLDDKVISSGATYTYGTIFSTILSSVFAGATTDMAQFGTTEIAESVLNLFPVTTRKTLTTGETWAVGGGYTLTAVSIDARATPRQVWINFKKDGALLDDRIISSGATYAYETIFNTLLSSVFAGATTDMAQFGTTKIAQSALSACINWQCSQWDRCISGQQARTCVDNNNCATEYNKPAVSQACQCVENWSCGEWTACSAGGQTRICADQNNCGTVISKPISIRDCQCVEDWSCGEWSACSGGRQSRTCSDRNSCGTITNKLATEKSCNLYCKKVSNTQDAVSANGADYSCDEIGYSSCKASATVGRCCPSTSSADSDCIVVWPVRNVVQGVDDKKTLVTGESWPVDSGYSVTINSIDARANPRQIWLELNKNGRKVDDRIVTQGKYYLYSNTNTSGDSSNFNILGFYIDSIFAGATSDMVQIKKAYINSLYRTNEVCVENWSCGEWTACSNFRQERVCSEINRCGTVVSKPAVARVCEEFHEIINPVTTTPSIVPTVSPNNEAANPPVPAPVVAESPENSEQIVDINLPANNVFQPNDKLKYSVAVYNALEKSNKIRIVARVVDEGGKSVMKVNSSWKIIKPDAVVKVNFSHVLSKKLKPGEYSVELMAIDVNNEIIGENSFSIKVEKLKQKYFSLVNGGAMESEIIYNQANVDKIKSDVILPVNQKLKYTYHNPTDSTQTVKIVRELVNEDGKKLFMRTFRAKVKKDGKVSNEFIQNVPNNLAPGKYFLRLSVYDASTKKLLAENSLDFLVELK